MVPKQEKTKRSPKIKYSGAYSICPHCLYKSTSSNPICARCGKKLEVSYQDVPFWKKPVQGRFVSYLLGILLILVGLIVIKRVAGFTEKHLSVIESQNTRYHQALIQTQKDRVGEPEN